MSASKRAHLLHSLSLSENAARNAFTLEPPFSEGFGRCLR